MTKTVTTGKATDLITFTRSTTGTYLDSVKYGDELVTNGDFSNGGANWSVNNTDATHYVVFENNSARFVADTSTPIVELLSDAVLEPNETYKVEVNISSITSGSIKIDGAGVSQLYNSVGTTVSFIKPSGGNNVIKFYRAQAPVDLVIDSVSVKKVIGNQGTSGEPLLRTADTNEPRIEYDADGNLKGLLIEEQRTNNLGYSEGFSTGWNSPSFCNETPNATLTPDGTVSGTKLQEDNSGTGGPRFFPTVNATITASQAQTISCFYKANTSSYSYLTIRHSNNNVACVEYDLTNGTINSTNAVGNMTINNSDIVSVGNGWYRCSLTATCSDSTGGGFYFVGLTNGSGVSDAGYPSYTLTGKSIYAWGAQVETGTFPTSYIPTSGSTVTRNADVASISTSKFEYNENASCVLIEASFLGRDSGEYPRLLDFAQGVNTSSIWATSTAVNIDKSGVGAQATVLWDMSPSKIAASVTSGDIALVVNDSAVDTSTATLVTTSTQFTIGATEGGSDKMSGHIKSIKYYPVRLTNNQLKALTQ